MTESCHNYDVPADRHIPFNAPEVNPHVRYAGPTSLRGLNGESLASLEQTIVLQVEDRPVAVLMPYATYSKIYAMAKAWEAYQKEK